MKKDIGVYFEDILDSIEKIKEYTKNLSEKKFYQSFSIQDAVLMRLAVIGESANKIPSNIRKKSEEIPWRKIINLRNIIVHDYSNINMARIWKIIKKDLLIFEGQIKNLLDKLNIK